MSIKKYLKNIKQIEPAPGPFAARLKFDLKERFLQKKQIPLMPALGYAIALFFFLTTAILLFNPSVAKNINYAITGKNKENIESEMKNSNQPRKNGYFYANELEKLPAGKPFLIKKVNNKTGKIFYIDNVQNEKSKVKIVY
ncbi:MAG: hypothetical protein U9N34_06110 [Candidatus Cloacimonadota bacterium]|nr:hypothetical protein [Candidatus Cloacimonadota bacterium]